MPDSNAPPTPLPDLKSGERSIVLSFLALSERASAKDQTPMEELALSVALKSSLKSTPN